jgi:prephenate dehydrogenase
MKIAIAGMGLIGGSLYKAAVRAGHEARGFRRGDTVDVSDSDVVFVALPPDSIVPWIRAHSAEFRRGAVVVDVCGVKTPVMSAMAETPPSGWTFIGGHPMAGKEVSGYENSTPDLFKGASMILTPMPGAPEETLAALRSLFADLGFGRVVVTDAAHHDEMIAFTSQLCHVIASAYAQDPRVKDAVGYSAGSYANMTRIATMDEAVWASLFLEDRAALVDVLDGFIGRLGEFRAAIASADRPALERLIASGAAAKRAELAMRN